MHVNALCAQLHVACYNKGVVDRDIPDAEESISFQFCPHVAVCCDPAALI